MEIQDRINELTKEKDFVEAFEKVKTPEEVVELFASRGVEVPADIAKELFEPLSNEGEELSEDDLENIAGGGKIGQKIGSAIGYGVYYGAGYVGGRLAGWDKNKTKSYAKKCAKQGAGIGGAIGYLGIPV